MEANSKNATPREEYIAEAEIKVRNLVAELNDEELNARAEKEKIKDRLDKQLTNQDLKIKNCEESVKILQDKIELLRQDDDTSWETRKSEFEKTMEYFFGDKETLIANVEQTIDLLQKQIFSIEQMIGRSTGEARRKFEKLLKELKVEQKNLSVKLQVVKAGTGESWKDVQQWFLEKTQKLKKQLNVNN